MRRFHKTGVVVAAALLFALAWSLSGEGSAASRTATTAASSRPAADKYPSEALAGACRRAAQAMLARVDDTFTSVVEPPFVVIGNLPKRDLQRMARGSVLAPARVLWKTYFRRRPDKVITILLLRDGKSYRGWAKKLFGDEKVAYYGYYKPGIRTLVMNISTGTGTLVHEMTHSLIAFDFPDVPDWFNEGLASLHEQCSIRSTRVVGLVNWRLPALQRAVRGKTLRPLRDLVTRDDFYGSLQGLNYAQARYFVMYMQQRRVLQKFYEHYRAHHTGAGAGVKAIESVLGRGIDKVEADFLRWAMTLRWPAR